MRQLTRRYLAPTVCYVVLTTSLGSMAQHPAGDARRGGGGAQQAQPPAVTPLHPVDVILGRPTATSVALSVLTNSDQRGVVACGTEKAHLTARTGAAAFAAGKPREILLSKLKPDTRYYYKLADQADGEPLAEGTFHTRRAQGSSFTFTVTADSHLDGNTDTALYKRTLANALTDAPDFHIDLGDTFMTDKHASRENAATQYLAQRYYLSQLSRSAPLYLVLGNHDGEDGRSRRGGADSLAVWSNAMRKRQFPNPVPDGIYTGNTTKDPASGLLEDYYAWRWGDALFVVLDPFWNSAARPTDGPWDLTLGDEQYKWLKRTLETSKAKYKFVFIHNLAGGIDRQWRGGAEAAAFGEWGGRNADGTDGFKEHRPGWDIPIHQLLVRNHVDIVFHGHDHLFARQDKDGIVYQEVPQPGDPRGNTRSAAEYGYTSGTILGSSGHMRVNVIPGKTTVDYVIASMDEASRKNREVAYSYTIAGRGDQAAKGK